MGCRQDQRVEARIDRVFNQINHSSYSQFWKFLIKTSHKSVKNSPDIAKENNTMQSNDT